MQLAGWPLPEVFPERAADSLGEGLVVGIRY